MGNEKGKLLIDWRITLKKDLSPTKLYWINFFWNTVVHQQTRRGLSSICVEFFSFQLLWWNNCIFRFTSIYMFVFPFPLGGAFNSNMHLVPQQSTRVSNRPQAPFHLGRQVNVPAGMTLHVGAPQRCLLNTPGLRGGAAPPPFRGGGTASTPLRGGGTAPTLRGGRTVPTPLRGGGAAPPPFRGRGAGVGAVRGPGAGPRGRGSNRAGRNGRGFTFTERPRGRV